MTVEEFLTRDAIQRFTAAPRPELRRIGRVQLELTAESGPGQKWSLDPAGPEPVRRGSAERPDCVITMPAALFGQIIDAPERAWPLFLKRRVAATDACRAGALMRALFPRALAASMSPRLFAALFAPRFDGLPEAHELGSGGVVRTTFIRRRRGFAKVSYSDRDGQAVWQGDIVLGTTPQAEAVRAAFESSGSEELAERSLTTRGLRVLSPGRLWPDKKKIPFEIDPAVPDQDRIKNAIDHWQKHTDLAFVAHTTEDDFIAFVTGTSCQSRTGRIGNRQLIELAADCHEGNVIHEIGHAVGLAHEHCRSDRDRFVHFNEDNVEPDAKHQFEIQTSDRQDEGAYDYGSIMHYGRKGYGRKDSCNSASETLTPTPPNDKTTFRGDPDNIGQREELSEGDRETIAKMYP